MRQYDVYGIGNALVDSDARITTEVLHNLNIEPGVMTLIDTPRHLALLNVLSDAFMHHGCGGSAANTLIALQQLGGHSFYSCKVANDSPGRLFLREMIKREIGCNLSLTDLPEGVTGQCLVLVTEDAERTMNTHLGISHTLCIEDLDFDAIAQSQYLYLEGYLVTSETGLLAMQAAVSHARQSGVKIALTLSDPSIVRHFKKELDLIIGDGIDLLFCNEDEALLCAGEKDVNDALTVLRSIANHVVLTRGSRGVVIADGPSVIRVPTHPVKAVDTVGAGDMFAGAYLYALCRGYAPQIASALANRLAAEVVSQYGARLEDEVVKSIKQEFMTHHFGLFPFKEQPLNFDVAV